MAAVLTQDAVLQFIQSGGGSVKNSELLLHFRNYIRDHEDRDRNRELFKKFVNSVAKVRQEDGVSYVVLKNQYRGTEGSSRPSLQTAGPTPAVGADKSRQKPQPRETEPPAPAGEAVRGTILPAAGIMTINNNNNNVGTSSPAAPVLSPNPDRTQLKTPSPSRGPVQEQRSSGGQPQSVGWGPPPGVTLVAPGFRHLGQTSQEMPEPAVPAVPGPQTIKGREVRLQSEGVPQQETPPNYDSDVTPHRVRYRPSYKSAMSCDEEEEEELPDPRRGSGGAVWPSSGPLPDAARATSRSSFDRQPPKIFIQSAAPESLEPESPPADPGPFHHVRPRPAGARVEAVRQPHMVQLSSGARLILPLASGAGPSIKPKPPPGSSRGPAWDSSVDDPRPQTAETRRLPQIEDLIQRAQSNALESRVEGGTAASAPHPSAGGLRGNQESTGDEVESSDGSTSTPRRPRRSISSRRLSREARGRMCRSLGNDLDQIVHGELGGGGGGGGGGGSEAARLNRLHLISSSLSLRANLSSSSLSSCSTPPRCQSLVELDEGAGHKEGRRSLPAAASSSSTTTHQDGHVGNGRQSLVPLEPKEHSWYVKAAAGAWPDIYSLFREEPSLLNKQDFISGFTVLHWIAKHGDHRVLNTLWYGVQKAGLAFHVNARSLSGHTPLHVAAMHGNKNVMRLLVKNFRADVRRRDIAGKRPWQYLSYGTTPDIFQLLAAPARAALGGIGRPDQEMMEQQKQQQQQQQQRRRRHHLSSASSGERSAAAAAPGMPKVKRSTSLAAFLKHKSLLPFQGQQPGTAI